MHQPAFDERYEFVQQLLQRRRAYIAASVMRLGQVQFTHTVETAGIFVEGSQVILYFNPEFCERIDNWELAGVLVHEALHFVFRHHERAARISTQQDRFLFGLACDAVINDLITNKFEELKLPERPVTGEWLIGRDVSRLAAEEVFRILRGRVAANLGELERLSAGQTLDDHAAWNQPSEEVRNRWTEEFSALVEKILVRHASRDPCYGSVALAQERLVPQSPPCHKSLARFLLDAVQAEILYDTIWTQPNRKLLAVYPLVILPNYQPGGFRSVLMAIDTSGSVPNSFMSVALSFARQKVARTKITTISFDTKWYDVLPTAAALRGGGGTRAQAVEEYALEKLPRYPDCVFILTDGFTPAPQLCKPERWTWLLPPWGSNKSIPKGCRIEYFDAEDALPNPEILSRQAVQAP